MDRQETYASKKYLTPSGSPEIGRFLQNDWIGYGDGMNLYRYCRNNPGNFVDPLGLISSLADAPAMAEVIKLYGMDEAIAIYGRNAIRSAIVQGTIEGVVITGMMMETLLDYNSAPSNDSSGSSSPSSDSSLDKILNTPDLLKKFFHHKHPGDKCYNANDAEKICKAFKNSFGGPITVEPPHSNRGSGSSGKKDNYHMHFDPNNHNKFLCITKEAFDKLVQIGCAVYPTPE